MDLFKNAGSFMAIEHEHEHEEEHGPEHGPEPESVIKVGETADMFGDCVFVSSQDERTVKSVVEILAMDNSAQAPAASKAPAARKEPAVVEGRETGAIAEPSTSSTSSSTSAPTSAKRGNSRKNIAQKNRPKSSRIDHLAAARKLQWQLRRTRSHSPEEVKTGRLICRHLLALLNEANPQPANQSMAQRSA